MTDDVRWMNYPASVRQVALRCCGYVVVLPVDNVVRHGFAKRHAPKRKDVEAAAFTVRLVVAEMRYRCPECHVQWRLEPDEATT